MPDLSSIIGENVALRALTDDRWKGLCPFHHERTPSFVVDDRASTFQCLSCGTTGDEADWRERQGGAA